MFQNANKRAITKTDENWSYYELSDFKYVCSMLRVLKQLKYVFPTTF